MNPVLILIVIGFCFGVGLGFTVGTRQVEKTMNEFFVYVEKTFSRCDDLSSAFTKWKIKEKK